MKAIVYERYGSPDALELRDVEVPAVTDDGVLVRVCAASTNPDDWHFMRGKPLFTRLMVGQFKPKAHSLGADLAGEVETVGRDATLGGRPRNDTSTSSGTARGQAQR